MPREAWIISRISTTIFLLRKWVLLSPFLFRYMLHLMNNPNFSNLVTVPYAVRSSIEEKIDRLEREREYLKRCHIANGLPQLLPCRNLMEGCGCAETSRPLWIRPFKWTTTLFLRSNTFLQCLPVVSSLQKWTYRQHTFNWNCSLKYGRERKKCNQIHGIRAPHSTPEYFGIGDGELLPFPNVDKLCRSRIPHVESRFWNSTCGILVLKFHVVLEFHMWNRGSGIPHGIASHMWHRQGHAVCVFASCSSFIHHAAARGLVALHTCGMYARRCTKVQRKVLHGSDRQNTKVKWTIHLFRLPTNKGRLATDDAVKIRFMNWNYSGVVDFSLDQEAVLKCVECGSPSSPNARQAERGIAVSIALWGYTHICLGCNIHKCRHCYYYPRSYYYCRGKAKGDKKKITRGVSTCVYHYT